MIKERIKEVLIDSYLLGYFMLAKSPSHVFVDFTMCVCVQTSRSKLSCCSYLFPAHFLMANAAAAAPRTVKEVAITTPE